MQLISLNTWGGRIPSIDSFLEGKKESTDIFCFQEMYHNSRDKEEEGEGVRMNFFEELKARLADFNGYFAPQVEGTGLAVFVRKSIAVGDVTSKTILSGDELSHLNMSNGSSYYPRNVQIVPLLGRNLTIYNFHGVPGGEKKDSPERELQEVRLLEILEADKNEKIVIGDFNLNPDTKMVVALQTLMQNPLNGSKFTSTRSSLYERKDLMPFADYAFVSNGIKINDFQVLPDEVSDHLALQLQFE